VFVTIIFCASCSDSPYMDKKREVLFKRWKNTQIKLPIEYDRQLEKYILVHYFDFGCGNCFTSLEEWYDFAQYIDEHSNADMLFIGNGIYGAPSNQINSFKF